MQLEHQQIENKKHNYSITLILEDLSSPQNIGLIIRTAEALGVERVIIISKEITELTPKIKRLTRSTEKYIKIDFFKDLHSGLNELKEYSFYALEKTTQSVNYKKAKINFPCAIICGNENIGVSPTALQMCKEHYHIDMYGKNTSLNVAIATGIFLSSLI